MKLKKDLNIQAFMEAVHTCRYDIYLNTPEGDHLNLRSALSQFVFASAVAPMLAGLDPEIVCHDKDLPILLPFLED